MKKRGMNMGKTRQASFLYLAAALLLTTCDVFGPSLEETLDYSRSIYPVTTWDELRAAVDTVPDGITIVVAKDLTADSVMEIPNNKRITIAAYRDRTVTIRRGNSHTSSFFNIDTSNPNASLTLGDSKHGGTLILDGGGEEGRDGTNPLVVIAAGDLTLEEGVVLQNNTTPGTVYGGGIHVSGSGSTITMNGGIIRNNSVTSGGGIYISNSYITFTMNGGTISDNTASSDNGGGVYVSGLSTTFKMNGGTINGNETTGSGGGVFVADGLFTMINGTISGNRASQYGGGVRTNSGNFTKTGGVIYGNDGPPNGNTAVGYSGIYGHAVDVFVSSTHYCRDTTAGPADILTGNPTWSGFLP
jgi:hypothetical protein